MAGKRADLSVILREVLGSKNCYFEPPASIRMSYPCIVYERSSIDPVRADDSAYIMHKRYSVMAIYEDPDDELPDRIANLPYCEHDRHYTVDNLHHDIFTLYF